MPDLASRIVRFLTISLSCANVATLATAQCTNVWRPGGTPGVNGQVNASVSWDPDGAGPATPVWVVGGTFQMAGDQVARNVAAYDPAAGTWSPLGTGLALTNSVSSLAVAANGDLIAGVTFGSAGGSLVRWNGAQWSTFAHGMSPISTHPLASGGVSSLGVLPNGDIVAGGAMRVVGVAGAMNIARWNGASWSALGSGSTEIVHAMTVCANGDVVAEGAFATAAGVGRWNGTSWVSLGTANDQIYALAELPNGDLIAGGTFATIGGVAAANIARWNGTAWSALGAGVNFRVNTVEPLAGGDFAAGGFFWTAGGVAALKVARWNGAQWSSYGPGLGTTFEGFVSTLTELPNGHLAAGGDFTTSGGTPVSRVAIWNGTAWTPLGGGFTVLPGACVLATALAPNGDVIVAGNFATGAAPGANSIARWNGSSWSALGSGFAYDQSNPPVKAVAVMPNGDVIAGGWFYAAGGVPADNIARWNGTVWSPLGAGFSFAVHALLVLPNGDLLAAGNMGSIQRWNGVAWSAIGIGLNGTVNTLVMAPNGDVIAGGVFSQVNGVSAPGIARWNGTAWSPLGSGVGGGVGSGVYAVAATPNGDLLVGGSFTSPGNSIARWNGSAWSPLGTGVNAPVFGLDVLPDGDVVAVGLFTSAGGAPANGIARWDGSAWSTFGSGLGIAVHGACTRMLAEGRLLVGGFFSTVNAMPSPYLARVDTTCPAIASASGTGCPSSGGNNSFVAATLPWIGSTFAATGTGLPATALVVTVTGFTSIQPGVVPLSLVFPQAGAGCDVLASPDILGVLVTTTGTVHSSIPLPNALSLVGAPFYHQLVPLEFNLLGALVSVTATNALQLTAGAF